MLSLLAATAAASDPIIWSELGLRPYLFEIGSFQLRYYSLAYLAGFMLAYWHLGKMLKTPGAPMAQRHLEDLFAYSIAGVIFGGRLGYAAFYKPELWTDFSHPGLVSWGLLRMWDGGMSFHGGVIGVLVAITWVAVRNKLNWLRICDYVAVGVPFGMFFGRIANFINGELWGRPVQSDLSWAMIFPTDPLQVARHPSQLYQAGLEGLLLIVVMLFLFWRTQARYRPGLLVGVFTVGISLARFFVEYYREPDSYLAYVVTETGLSRGQWLTLPLIAIGLAVMIVALVRAPVVGVKPTATPPRPA